MIMKKITYLLTAVFLTVFCWQGNAQLLAEDFTGQTLPTGWTNVDNGATTGYIWEFTNPSGRSIAPPFDSDFAILDSDNWGNGLANATLTTTTFDASSGSAIFLSFDQQYRYCCVSTASVEVFDGTTWTSVYDLPSSSVGYPGTPNSQSIDITAATGGSAVAQVRFTYTGDFAWWWAIDNVSVIEVSCAPPSNLNGIANFDGSADFDWDDEANATDGYIYKLQLASDPESTDPPFAQGSGPDSDWSLTAGTLTNGEAYTLYVSSDCGLETSSFSSYNFVAPLFANDNCSGATAISCDETIAGDTTLANGDLGLDSVGSSNNSGSLWYTYTGFNDNDPGASAGDPGNSITLSTCNDSGATDGDATYDSKIDIYTGDCNGTLTLVGGNDDGGGCGAFSSLVSNFNTTVGTVYYIRVSGYDNASVGAFNLSMTCESPCAPVAVNDDCATAEVIPNEGTTTGDNTCQNNAITNPSCDPFGSIADVWYEYTSAAGSTGTGITFTFDDGGTNTAVDLNFALYVGCGTADQICGDINGFPPVSGEQELITLPENFTFQMQVWTSDENTGTFTVEFEDFTAPDCATDPVPASGSNVVYTPGTNDVDVSWTAPATGTAPTNYNIYSGLDPSNLVFFETIDATETSYTFQGPPEGTEIFWQVLPRSGGALAEGCEIWSFIASKCSGTTFTWNGSSWSGGLGTPGVNDFAIFTGNYDTALNGSLDVCGIQVEENVIVLVEADTFIQTNEGNNAIAGNLIVADRGSFSQTGLVAVTNKLATGVIDVRKVTPVLNDTDFSILSSPMDGESREGVYASAANVKSHVTANFVPNEDVGDIGVSGIDNWADDNGDNWQNFPAGNLVSGTGYLVKPQLDGAGSPAAYTTNYLGGTLNSGTITVPTVFNTSQNDSPNMLGNPYASAISVVDFLTANPDAGGGVYFWEHIAGPSNTYPGHLAANYEMTNISVCNAGGCTPASGVTRTPFIPSGQGFGVKVTAPTDVQFTNAMRVTGTNDEYRSNELIERVNVKVSNATYGLKSSTLIAFTDNATNGHDQNYDAKRLGTPISIYSFNHNTELVIQGRSAFTEDQIVPIGFTTLVDELQEYTISLGELEGDLVTNTTVYLRDNLLNTVTNLSETDYTFTAAMSNQQERFALFFEAGVLGTDEIGINAISLYPNPTNSLLTISSPSTKVNTVVVHDISGRQVAFYDFTEQNSYQIDVTEFGSAIYFVEINTDNGSITKRIIKE
jgi:hypothetical protein